MAVSNVVQGAVSAVTEAAIKVSTTTGTEVVEKSSEVSKSINNTTGSLFMLQLVAFIFILIFFGVVYYLTKNKKGIIVGKNKLIKEVERYYYNPKFFITIVKIDKELYIMAVNDGNTTVVGKIAENETIEEIIKEEEKEKINFKDMLAGANKGIDELKSKLIKMRQEKNEK